MTPTLEELELQLNDLTERQQVTAALVAALKAYEQKVGKAPEMVAVPARQRLSSRSAPAMEATERVAASLMSVLGGPVQTAQVVDEMRDQGLELPEHNTLNTISARLSNNPKFKGRRGKGYWFADRSWPGELEEKLASHAEQPALTNTPVERENEEAPAEQA